MFRKRFFYLLVCVATLILSFTQVFTARAWHAAAVDEHDLKSVAGRARVLAAGTTLGTCSQATASKNIGEPADQVVIPGFQACGTNDQIIAVLASYRANVFDDESYASSVSGVTYAEAPLIKGCSAHSNEYVTEIWYLPGSAASSGNIQIVWPVSIRNEVLVTAVALSNVDTSISIEANCDSDEGTWQSDPEIGTHPSLEFESFTDRMVFGGMTTYIAGNLATFDGGAPGEIWQGRQDNIISAVGLLNAMSEPSIRLG